jgi:universal stress protein E
MAKSVKRILVAVREPQAVSRALLTKVAAIARPNKARVELFHATNTALALEAIRGVRRPAPPAHTAERIEQLSRTRLQRAASSAVLRGLKVSVHVEWDYPAHEAIVRRALRQSSDLVVAQTQPRYFGSRLLLANTDWELIRHCPVPLLLVKGRAPYRKPVVLAAVDPFHVNAKRASLDSVILRAASGWARALRGQVHIFHAYVPEVAIVPLATAPPIPIELSPELLALEERRIRGTIGRLAAQAGIPPARCHVVPGDVPSALAPTLRRTRARILVMGAVSRSALQRFLIGSSAERVLDRVDCDVLIVKPAGYRTGVPKRIARRRPAAPRRP